MSVDQFGVPATGAHCVFSGTTPKAIGGAPNPLHWYFFWATVSSLLMAGV
jgi:hypothetical protein